MKSMQLQQNSGGGSSQSGLTPAPTIVQQYSLSLQRDLKTNSLIDIKKLTNIARDEIKHYKHIVKVISTRIKTASTNEKLPALYLLDSLIKNIGGEYIEEFSGGISDLFFYSFREQIDLNIQLKYLKLLKTWVTIFGEHVIHDIEERVMKIPHYGPKQVFNYEQLKEKYNKHVIFVNPNKFCKSSNDFSQEFTSIQQEQHVEEITPPNLDWLNKILKTSSSLSLPPLIPPPPPNHFTNNINNNDGGAGTYSTTGSDELNTMISFQNESNEIINNPLVRSLYSSRNPFVTNHQPVIVEAAEEETTSRGWFLGDKDWIKNGIKKRERIVISEEFESPKSRSKIIN